MDGGRWRARCQSTLCDLIKNTTPQIGARASICPVPQREGFPVQSQCKHALPVMVCRVNYAPVLINAQFSSQFKSGFAIHIIFFNSPFFFLLTCSKPFSQGPGDVFAIMEI